QPPNEQEKAAEERPENRGHPVLRHRILGNFRPESPREHEQREQYRRPRSQSAERTCSDGVRWLFRVCFFLLAIVHTVISARRSKSQNPAFSRELVLSIAMHWSESRLAEQGPRHPCIRRSPY